ncbi:MAG TPA: alpha/beta fold hydrolase [Trebonia sp.]|nr:alpha/beta fold hydrolase [Trebonia sp.]
MPWYDMPLERLREYRTSTQEPDGLDDWWASRAAQARELASPLTRTPYRPGLYGPVDVDDVEFSGGAGDRIRAWYLRPRDTPGAPVVVKFIGYGGGRGVPAEHVLLPALGYALLVMDTRGQGGRWTTGATPDGATGTGPENSLVMTRGIARPEDYYYTRLFTDAVRAIDTAIELTGASAGVAVTGGSQGGALALAAAALRPDVVRVCHADVPFLCDIQRAITLAPRAPYTEIPEFLAENTELIEPALNTLRYVDCALLARRITATTLVSVGLMDDICPPSTVFAAYNEITADKEIAVYPYSDHSCPRGHAERQLAHLSRHLPAS